MSTSTLGLLLADPIELRPTLAGGLPDDAANDPPRPEKAPRGVDAVTLSAPDADPNDLPLQRWGVIAPPGPAGDAALEAIAPLVRLREAEQGEKVKVYRNAPLAGDAGSAARWKDEVWQEEEESERPRYLLVLGDVDQLSFELQHVLASAAFVGRLHADALDDYAAYAAKVVRWAKAPSHADKPDALFFVADDSSDATRQGRQYLVDPCVQMARQHRRFPVGEVVALPPAFHVNDLLVAGDRQTPSVLLSVSHGIGRPRNGWRSVDQQRQLQGSLLVASDAPPSDALLTAERMAHARFLPGGLWFCLACFGAGTPARSAFYPWLSGLRQMGAYDTSLDRVLESLPADGDRPFLAAMPRAALANPDGPLAVVGHVDLAWTYGFTDPNQPGHSRAARIFSSIQAMARGSRAGVALDALMRSYRAVNDELTGSYQAEEEARVWGRPNPVDPRRRGSAFMLRNDLRGYVLLGDPAVRLPLRVGDPVARPIGSARPAVTAAAAPAPGRDPVDMERAVLAVLQGEEAPKAIAARHGASRAELDDWVETYRAAGRAALGKRG